MAVSATTTTTTTTTLLVMIYSVFLFIFFLNPSFSMAQSDYILYSGEDLNSGDSLIYRGMYTFTMQEDCNLVLYAGSSAIWASNTDGLAINCHCSMQSDGNLVIYEPDGAPIWASNTDREKGSYVLVLRKDRNVVIYGGAIWASNTNINFLSSKRGGGTMNVVSITNLPAPIIYRDGAKNVTRRITTRAGRVS